MELQIVYKKTEDLIPYAMNARVHSDQQVAQIAASIKEFGFNSPVAIDKDNGIICGHGRVLAAKKLGLAEVPTVCLAHLTEIQKKAYILADNKLALNASWDENILRLEIEDLQLNDFSTDNLGFDSNEIKHILGKRSEIDDVYNTKITTPVYEITGAEPKISELYDASKSYSLIDRIDKAKIPEELKVFLRFAAYRHCSFNFANIAEYYAHCDADTQRLFEESALVIIDLEDAIANGFVKMSKNIDELIKIEREQND